MELIYYGMVLFAVVLFGVYFFLSGVYEKERGNSWYATFVFTLVSCFAGGVALLALNGFSLGITPFTLIMSAITAINAILFTFFSIKALGVTNLSLFSLFSMIGGMALPFAAGILFYGEGITAAKVLCFVFITVSMLFTVERDGKKGGFVYYAGVFITNGMAGLLAMIFSNSAYPKGTETDYAVLYSLIQAAIAVPALLLIPKKKRGKAKPTFKIGALLVFGGIILIYANYLLLIALQYIDGSAQYPLVTGGVMAVSTVIGFFTSSKPRKKDVLAVCIAILGMLALLLPI